MNQKNKLRDSIKVKLLEFLKWIKYLRIFSWKQLLVNREIEINKLFIIYLKENKINIFN